MEDYVAARPQIFFTGVGGTLRSNRALCQTAGLYACDLLIGSTLQMDLQGNSSTVTRTRIAGFGGAPNMGSDPRGRRHATEAWLKAGAESRPAQSTALPRGRKLVVQIVESFGESMEPTFVERLAAVEIAEELGLPIPPVMIYGDDVTHIITENGIANLLLCRSPEEREQAIRGVAGYTEVGRQRDRRVFQQLRERGVVRLPEDLDIDPLDADRTMLAAGSIRDLVRGSGGLYRPPARFRNY
jgi:malonate decarboxylase alpha subunit